MTDNWPITECSPNVALQLANQWAIAVAAQARRIQHPEHTQERVPDAYIQVMALHSLLRAAEMAKQTIPSRIATNEIKHAIADFLDAVVVSGTTDTTKRDYALIQARNVLEHFDNYYRGTGDQQKKAPVGKNKEELAQDYRIDLELPADRPRLRVGPLRPSAALFTIDLVTSAPTAARQLVARIHATITQHESQTAGQQ